MNAVDGSDHYTTVADEPPPSLLTVILDTNPNAWALLSDTLPLAAAISNLLVFINAHLAFNNANRVAVIASHPQRAEFLFPPSPNRPTETNEDNAGVKGANSHEKDTNGTTDTQMSDDAANASIPSSSNHYRPFHALQTALLASLTSLFSHTSPSSLSPTTSLAGALTLALTYMNKTVLTTSTARSSAPNTTSGSTFDPPTMSDSTGGVARHAPTSASNALSPRILILSVSGDLASQYIPIMNSIFACQRSGIPIDICKIAGDTVFLQQACDATKGTYIKLEEPRGLLQYLMMGFLPDRTIRDQGWCTPGSVGVDFRAACFCHRRVVDTGWVCSVCLSIFCSVPEDSVCLTCGTHLKVGNQGAKPVVVAQRKKKRRGNT